MTITWNDLNNKIHATGAIDAAARMMILTLANTQAHREMGIWTGMGMPRSWAQCFGEAMTLAWCRARTYLDNELALRERSRLPVAEQLARSAELQAAIFDNAIPPQHAVAAEWRARAASLRRSQFTLIAAE